MFCLVNPHGTARLGTLSGGVNQLTGRGATIVCLRGRVLEFWATSNKKKLHLVNHEPNSGVHNCKLVQLHSHSWTSKMV